MKLIERILFKAAISKWGKAKQLEQANEEMSELMVELHKIRRGRNAGLHDLAGEVADVGIMLDQIKVMYGQDFEEEVNMIRGVKIARLHDRVSDPEHLGN